MSGCDRVVVFTCDRGFIVPTLVAASQVASQRRRPDDFDVLILVIGFGQDELKGLRAVFDSLSIHIEPMEQDLFARNSDLHFEKSHVPAAAMARLSSAGYLARGHEHVVYLDGDVQVTGDIWPLLSHDVRGGRILAATDRYVISQARLGYSGRLWRAARAYLDGLKIRDMSSYFNSGVLAARRGDWAAICTDALDFYKENSELCLFHDQSALNAVSQGRREALSPRYNYITPFAEATGVDAYDPAIVHFTGSDKPWLFSDRAPWYGAYGQPYRDILQDHPVLLKYASNWAEKRVALTRDTPKRRSALAELSSAWLESRRRGLFERYMKRRSFAF